MTVECAVYTPAGDNCPRQPEVTVHFVNTSTGQTESRRDVCPIHAFEAVGRAFIDITRDSTASAVIAAPLG